MTYLLSYRRTSCSLPTGVSLPFRSIQVAQRDASSYANACRAFAEAALWQRQLELLRLGDPEVAATCGGNGSMCGEGLEPQRGRARVKRGALRILRGRNLGEEPAGMSRAIPCPNGLYCI